MISLTAVMPVPKVILRVLDAVILDVVANWVDLMTNDKIEPGSDGSQLPGPGAGFTFLYYFSMTIAITVIVGSQGLDLPVGAVELYRIGIVLGLLAGCVGTYFNRTVSFEISAQQSSTLKTQLEKTLAESGFLLDEDATEQQENYSVYRRSGLASLFSGKVFVAHRPTATQIVSRAATRRKLQSSL